MRAVDPAVFTRSSSAQHPHKKTATRLAIDAGMTGEEGLQALDRILGAEVGSHVVVCTVPLDTWIAELESETRSVSEMDGQLDALSASAEADHSVRPRNAIERELAAYWSKLLGLPRVGVDENFFDLGGHSLLALRMFSAIKKKYDVELPLDTLFRAPTIALCAAVIAERIGASLYEDSDSSTAPITEANPIVSAEWSPLVPIETTGTRTPFFCVHGAMGNVLILRDLALHVGQDRPVYALQMQGVDGLLPPLGTIEEMAAQYVTAIREVQPDGPYLLGGYSGGGLIAFEMAQQLRRVGEQTELIALLDTYSPLVPPRRWSRTEHLLAMLSYGPAYFTDKLKKHTLRRAHGRTLQLIDQHLNQGEVVPLELRDEYLRRAYLQAQARYEPKPFSGRLALFRAAEILPIFEHALPFLGWETLAEDGVEVHEVPGSHDAILLQPHVGSLAKVLSRVLQVADHRIEGAAARTRLRLVQPGR